MFHGVMNASAAGITTKSAITFVDGLCFRALVEIDQLSHEFFTLAACDDRNPSKAEATEQSRRAGREGFEQYSDRTDIERGIIGEPAENWPRLTDSSKVTHKYEKPRRSVTGMRLRWFGQYRV